MQTEMFLALRRLGLIINYLLQLMLNLSRVYFLPNFYHLPLQYTAPWSEFFNVDDTITFSLRYSRSFEMAFVLSKANGDYVLCHDWLHILMV